MNNKLLSVLLLFFLLSSSSSYNRVNIVNEMVQKNKMQIILKNIFIKKYISQCVFHLKMLKFEDTVVIKNKNNKNVKIQLN